MKNRSRFTLALAVIFFTSAFPTLAHAQRPEAQDAYQSWTTWLFLPGGGGLPSLASPALSRDAEVVRPGSLPLPAWAVRETRIAADPWPMYQQQDQGLTVEMLSATPQGKKRELNETDPDDAVQRGTAEPYAQVQKGDRLSVDEGLRVLENYHAQVTVRRTNQRGSIGFAPQPKNEEGEVISAGLETIKEVGLAEYSFQQSPDDEDLLELVIQQGTAFVRWSNGDLRVLPQGDRDRAVLVEGTDLFISVDANGAMVVFVESAAVASLSILGLEGPNPRPGEVIRSNPGQAPTRRFPQRLDREALRNASQYGGADVFALGSFWGTLPGILIIAAIPAAGCDLFVPGCPWDALPDIPNRDSDLGITVRIPNSF